ncbi:tripartite tricarboxylate transporter TctB family protein [Jannaschia sp. M317]|uniref:tripartite tricarboxylate transporter TctB family protein n=1 Tax=Jannaschia sp. M317 TaxID=2867011 RepID=UPI0021A420A6|nr:tripartite tricarboxylate transporter TctB family protein [Jannaschia sp. M317]UWQ17907.1 tripartite tricarboxylate transporter TctB family protein [Jannaschia sp. M317]
MKFDDGVNGLLAVLGGVGMVLYARTLPDMAHIDYGPGFFPMLVGWGLILAGGTLIGRRILSGGGAVAGLIAFRGRGRQSLIGFAVVLGTVLAYVLLVDTLGFLLTAPILLFAMVWWFERKPIRAAVIAVVGTFVFHSFFYQIMSAPLPWGPLKPWSGVLTW